MNYEERYNELIDAIKVMMEANPHDEGIQNWVQDNVPELKESEDELTWLTKYIEEEAYNLSIDIRDDEDRIKLKQLQKAIVWLEKQGEHKSVDKVEPKFQNGQWVVWQNKCYKVNYNGCGYELIDQNGLTTSCEYGTIDENAHLWTIEDAKDGDVLIVYGLPFIYCCFDDYQGNYCCIDPNGEFRTTFDFGFNGKTILPATKEQRDILFSKMKEAGYEWNAEKKEIKKIGDEPKNYKQQVMSEID